MGYGSLQAVYRSNFELSFFHGYSIDTLKTMVPWERYLLIDMIAEELKEQKRDRIEKEMSRANR